MERVQRALRADERDGVRALSSLEVPPWLRPGLGLEPPSEADVDAITVKTREREQDVVRELDGPPKPKRVKVQPPPEAVQCTTAGRRRGAQAQLHLGSQRVFGGINRSSIHRWKLKKKPHSGRPHKLSETQFLSAAVLFHDLVKKRVHLKVKLANSIFQKHVGVAVSSSWTYRLKRKRSARSTTHLFSNKRNPC